MENKIESSKVKTKIKTLSVWALLIVFLVIAVHSLFGTSDKPEEAKSSPTPIHLTTEVDTTNKTDIQIYVERIGKEVMPAMITANSYITGAGNLGSGGNFEAAKKRILAAKEMYVSAKGKFDSITAPEEAKTLNTLLSQSLDTYIKATDIYLEGVNNLDSNEINRGSNVYKEATQLVGRVNDEIKRLSN